MMFPLSKRIVNDLSELISDLGTTCIYLTLFLLCRFWGCIEMMSVIHRSILRLSLYGMVVVAIYEYGTRL